MNDRTAGAVLLVIGVVALFAAIVGGGIKIREIEVGSVPSKVRQWLLAAFGLVVGFIGLIMVLPDDAPANVADSENVVVVDENTVDANGDVVDKNATDASSEDPNQAAPADDNASAE